MLPLLPLVELVLPLVELVLPLVELVLPVVWVGAGGALL
jgi:hypothetical protein